MSHSNLNIETERLIIRPFKVEDIEPCYIMNLDAEVSRHTGDGGLYPKKKLNRGLSKMYLEITENMGLVDLLLN
jgi:hypothetical protein